MPKNVLLISLDAVRADHLSGYGYKRETSPFLNQFGKENVQFDYAYSATNWTLPAHVSMMTGMTMDKHGIGADRTGVRKVNNPQLTTLPEYLRALGYETFAFTNCGYLSRATNFDRGFDYFNFVENLVDKTHPFYSSRILGKYWARAINGAFHKHLYRRKDQGAARSLGLFQDYIKHRRNRSQPFFGFLHLFEAHAPYHVPPQYADHFSKSSKEREAWLNLHKNPWYHVTGVQPVEGKQFSDLIDAYDGSILYLDAVIKKLVGFLESERLLEDTIVIITADHGEALGDHGSIGHGGDSLSEGVIRVPMILHIPGHTFEHLSPPTPVGHIDIFPTLLHLIGATDTGLEEQIQGRNMLDFIHENGPDRLVISESLTIPLDGIKKLAPGMDVEAFNKYLRAVRFGRNKLVTSSLGEQRLYDVLADPDEENDLSEENPQTVQLISDQLEAWLASYERIRPIVPLSDSGFEQSVRERLVNLGYLE